MSRKVLYVLMAAALVIITFIPTAHAGKADDTLNFAFKEELKSMDNYFTTDRVTIVMGRLLYDSLLYRDPETFKYKPLLATSYKYIDDQTIEFELRQGVKYHNGEEFDADDVVYTFNFVLVNRRTLYLPSFSARSIQLTLRWVFTLLAGSETKLKVYTTSSASNSSPLWYLTPRRSSNSIV